MGKNTFKIIVAGNPSKSQVLLNDQPMEGVRRVSFDLDARSMPFMTLEIYGETIVEGEFVEEKIRTITIAGPKR